MVGTGWLRLVLVFFYLVLVTVVVGTGFLLVGTSHGWYWGGCGWSLLIMVGTGPR